jgi:hypothetical protein
MNMIAILTTAMFAATLATSLTVQSAAASQICTPKSGACAASSGLFAPFANTKNGQTVFAGGGVQTAIHNIANPQANAATTNGFTACVFKNGQEHCTP